MILQDRPRIVEIKEIQKETWKVKTFKFEDRYIAKDGKPGQFLMVWIPGSGEIPISISNILKVKNEVWITVAKVGETTTKMHKLKIGDKIGIRGPYGNSFNLNYDKILVIGGGYGVAPLAYASELASERGSDIYGIVGAKREKDLLFVDRLKKVAEDIWITTEDGSWGFRGVVTDLLDDAIKSFKPDVILTCGPEKMMAETYKIAKNYRVEIQASLERYMKCGIGICGSCAIGRYRVCIDGPIFNTEMLKEVEAYFGK